MFRTKLYTSIITTLIILCSSSLLNAKDNNLMMEVEDHNLCLSKVAQVGQKDINNQVYWECRIKVIKHQKLDNSNKKKEIIENLQDRLDMAKNDNYAKLELIKEIRDHKICIKRGFLSTTKNNEELLKYYTCRIKASQKRFEQPPFAATSYKQERTHYLDLDDEDIKDYIHKRRFQLKEFNFCSNYLKSKITFGNCTKAYASYEKCLTNIPNSLIIRQQNDLVFCKEQSVKQFPDEMAIYTDNKDYSGPKFSKTDTIELRTEFHKRCLKKRERDILKYAMDLPDICKTKLNNWK
jgi:hypothetical protein